MDKKIILVLLAVLICLSVPTFAALEWTVTTLYFNVQQVDEISVQILNQEWTTSNTTGNWTASSIEFNSSTGITEWDDAEVVGQVDDQTDDNGIIVIWNSGSSTPTHLNISTNVSTWGSGAYNCLDLHYFANNTTGTGARYSAGTPASESSLTTTNVTLDPDFDPGEYYEVWLWGNFSTCSYGTVGALFYVFANFA